MIFKKSIEEIKNEVDRLVTPEIRKKNTYKKDIQKLSEDYFLFNQSIKNIIQLKFKISKHEDEYQINDLYCFKGNNNDFYPIDFMESQRENKIIKNQILDFSTTHNQNIGITVRIKKDEFYLFSIPQLCPTNVKAKSKALANIFQDYMNNDLKIMLNDCNNEIQKGMTASVRIQLLFEKFMKKEISLLEFIKPNEYISLNEIQNKLFEANDVLKLLSDNSLNLEIAKLNEFIKTPKNTIKK